MKNLAFSLPHPQTQFAPELLASPAASADRAVQFPLVVAAAAVGDGNGHLHGGHASGDDRDYDDHVRDRDDGGDDASATEGYPNLPGAVPRVVEVVPIPKEWELLRR